MISKQLLDHSLFLLKTLGDSLWILPKQAFATEQSVGSWVINRVCNNFLVLCLTCSVSSWDLVYFEHPLVEYWLTILTMSIGVHKLHKIHCWGWVLLDKTKTAAKGDYRVSFWTRNLDHEVNVCSVVWSWTGQQNEWFLSETGSGFEGLSSKPLPKLS